MWRCAASPLGRERLVAIRTASATGSNNLRHGFSGWAVPPRRAIGGTLGSLPDRHPGYGNQADRVASHIRGEAMAAAYVKFSYERDDSASPLSRTSGHVTRAAVAARRGAPYALGNQSTRYLVPCTMSLDLVPSSPRGHLPTTAPIILNDGVGIRWTDFWSSARSRAGQFHVSHHAGSLRILLPTPVGVEAEVGRELREVIGCARRIVVTISERDEPLARWPAIRMHIEWLSEPFRRFSIILTADQVDGHLACDEAPTHMPTTVWGRDVAGKPERVGTFIADVRMVPTLGPLLPWLY